MKLNLRKARKLESKIQTYLDTNGLTSKVAVRTLGSIDEAMELVKEGEASLLNNLEERLNLLDLRYYIRRLIETANEEGGINYLINEKVKTQKIYADLSSIQNTPAYSRVELQDQLTGNTKVLERGEVANNDYYSRRSSSEPKVKTSFKVPVLDQVELDRIEERKLRLKRRIEDIDDELGAKNLTQEIALEESNVKLLKSHGIL